MYNLDLTKVAETLKTLRMKTNPSVTAFARNIGVDRMTVTKFERGDATNISLDSFVKILNGLGVPFDDVIPRERNSENTESVTDIVIKSLDTFSIQNKHLFCALIVGISEQLSKK